MLNLKLKNTMAREILFAAKDLNGVWQEGLVTKDYADAWFITNGVDTWQIDPETISQWTGLKDKNGKYIFEGDIMKWSKNVEVVFSKGMFGARLPSTNYPNSMISLEKLEVVGNRFDNPELMQS